MKYNKKKLMDLLQFDRNSNLSIAQKTGVSDGMIGRICRGESIPSLDTLPLFAEYYGKDINFFFDLEEKKSVDGIKITDGNEYLLNRFEEVVKENTLLKHKLEAYEDYDNKSYSLPDVPNYKVAEAPVELKKK